MDKHDKHEVRGPDRAAARPGQIISRTITAQQGSAKAGKQGAELTEDRARRSCCGCVFVMTNIVLWARTLLSGFPVMGLCANHSDTPGQVRPIPYGGPCRNFRAKPYRIKPPEPPNENVRYIALTRGLCALVDAEDYEWLNHYKWHAHRTPSGTVYAVRGTKKGQVFMHRMIMNPPDGMVVDHINGNGQDNRRCNLRICTPSQNSRNRRKHADGKSRFIGVSPWGKKWQVFVGHRYVGIFHDEVEAARVRDRVATEVYGEHARLNFPPDGPDSEGQQISD